MCRRASRSVVSATSVLTLITLGVALSLTAGAQAAVTESFSTGASSFLVPSGVTSLQVHAVGGRGGRGYFNTSLGGRAAVIDGTLAVTPGDTLHLFVAGNGAQCSGSQDGAGYNGGGRSSMSCVFDGGGGGASDIRTTAGDLSTRLLVAAGGGGGGDFSSGGDAGAPGPPAQSCTPDAQPGTAGAGGAAGATCGANPTAGTAGSFGQGGDSSYRSDNVGNVENSGGGGGGGWYGGGGGTVYGGGAGGSSRTTAAVSGALTSLAAVGSTPVITLTYPGLTLSVVTAGTGSGFVAAPSDSSSSPTALDCGRNTPGVHTDCAKEYRQDASVTLTAYPDANTDFTGFTGGCVASGTTCTTSVDAAKTVIATFTLRSVPPPGTPGLSSGTSPNGGVFGLAWSASTGSVTYTLQHKDADDAAYSDAATALTSPAFAFTVGALEAEGTWLYRAQASDGTLTSAFSSDSAAVKVDRTAPLAPTASADRAPEYAGGGGWYRDAVTVSFAPNGDPSLPDSSAGSGIDAGSISAPQARTTSGSHTVDGTVADVVGNVSTAGSLTVQVDATDPSVSISCPATDPFQGTSATATWTASDAHSGLASAAGGAVTLDTSTLGAHTATAPTARDNVDRTRTATCTYTVRANPPPPPPLPGPPPPPPPPPPLTLTLTGAYMTPKAFAPGGPATVRFRLARAAFVRMAIDRVLTGRQRGGRCIVGSTRPGPRCTRFDPLPVRVITVFGLAGANRIAFDGKVGTEALPVGRYRLRVSAYEGAETTPQSPMRFRVTG